MGLVKMVIKNVNENLMKFVIINSLFVYYTQFIAFLLYLVVLFFNIVTNLLQFVEIIVF